MTALVSGGVLIAVLLAACAPSAPATNNDTVMAAQWKASINEVYGRANPPDWYAFVGPRLDVAVRDGVGIIATSLTASDTDLAATICHAVAASVYDINAHPIGISAVIVIAGGQQLATCSTGT